MKFQRHSNLTSGFYSSRMLGLMSQTLVFRHRIGGRGRRRIITFTNYRGWMYLSSWPITVVYSCGKYRKLPKRKTVLVKQRRKKQFQFRRHWTCVQLNRFHPLMWIWLFQHRNLVVNGYEAKVTSARRVVNYFMISWFCWITNKRFTTVLCAPTSNWISRQKSG